MGLLSAALVMAASTQATAQEYIFTTLAGPPELGSDDADGSGSLARFRGPSGAAVDIAGNVYVADYHNDTIRKVTPGGVVTTLAGAAGYIPMGQGVEFYKGSVHGTGSDACFSEPCGVAVDSNRRTGPAWAAR